MTNKLDKVLEGTGKVIETVPEIYEDAIKPAAKETGKTLSIIPRVINAALVPLLKWVEEKEYSLAETKKLLGIKLANVGEEKIVTPEAYVAVPAIQAISYSMDSEELRNLYANLLAKAMNVDTKDFVHPSFVEIIKQMSPTDAQIFKIIYEKDINPVIDLSISRPNGGNIEHKYNISWIDTFSYEVVSISIDNLIRLGLIEIPFGTNYSEDSHYDIVRETGEYKRIKIELESLHMGSIYEYRKIIKKTSMASSFYKVCVLDW